jgi:Transposase DDE domain
VFNHPEILEDPEMNPDLDALATRLYVTIDDLLIAHPEWAPERPEVGIAPKLSDAELVTLAVIQALLGFTSEARFIRHAHAHLRPWFPYLPDRPGYNKRLRHAMPLMRRITSALARACTSWHDDVWLVDSTPVECGRSRETAKRSALAGWATYGYCASHSRWFWGLRLHLVTTPSGLPIAFGLTGATTDERDTCLELITTTDADHTGQTIIADKGYRRASFEAELNTAGITLIRPALRSEPPRPGQRFLRPLRQIIESVNQTLKGQLDLERHGGRTKPGVCARVLQRILALTATIWHNETSDHPRPARTLTPYDH